MPRSSRAGRNVALPLFALLTGLVVLSTAAPAAAHDQLLSTEPADGSTVDTVPEKVVLTFSEGSIAESEALGRYVLVTSQAGYSIATGG